MAQKKRLVARRVTIGELVNGSYYIQEGFNPNYVLTDLGLKISRLRLIGTVLDIYINQDKSYGAVIIDDGTDTIRLKVFKEMDIISELKKGDIVEVIGKIREYNEERYVTPEVIIKRDIHFELLRKIEYEEFRKKWIDLASQVREMVESGKNEEEISQSFPSFEKEDLKAIIKNSGQAQKKNEEVPSGKIISDLIDKLDEGNGVDYSILIEKSGLSGEKVEKIINDFLSDGTCYEPKPGVIKKL